MWVQFKNEAINLNTAARLRIEQTKIIISDMTDSFRFIEAVYPSYSHAKEIFDDMLYALGEKEELFVLPISEESVTPPLRIHKRK